MVILLVGHIIDVIIGLVIVDCVAVAVVVIVSGLRGVAVWDRNEGFSINFTLYCLLLVCWFLLLFF